ncbi:hypothetical protein [Rufibacter immobilis]|uniref:hypothetical protein n=1 Tax=Rufibacter immobilis TaxID=1348778 RepID=UPI0035E54648
MKELPKLCFSLFLLLVACQEKPVSQEAEAPITEQAAPVQQKLHNPLLTEYEQFLKSLDSSRVENMSIAAEKYKGLFKGQPTSVADSGYVLFEEFYLRTSNALNDAHYEDSIDYSSLVIIPTKATPENLPKKLKEYRNTLATNGFQVAMTEGFTYLQQDRDFVVKHFYPFISPVLKEFLVQVNKENKDGFQEDAGLTIGPTQLADRVIWWGNFTKKHPDFILLKHAEAEKKAYLNTLFEGMDNSPVLSHGTNKLDPYYAEAYQYLNKKAPASKANNLVKPFYVALQKGDTAKANTLLTRYKLDRIID